MTSPGSTVTRKRADRFRRAMAPLLAGGAVIACTWWALAPLPDPRVTLAPMELGQTPAAESPRLAMLDPAAFLAPLWVVPPSPQPAPPPQPPPPPPPPFRLQLLAIVQEVPATSAASGRYTAVFYDPEADTILFAVEGQVLGTRTVQRIASDQVQVQDGDNHVIALTLRLERPEGAGR